MHIPESMSRSAGRQLLVLKKQSPHILFVVGIGGLITSTVLACRSTLKLNQTLDDIQTDINNVKELKHSQEESSNYPTDEWRRDLVYIYGKGIFKLVQLYGVPTLIGIISIGALTKSHTQLANRNAALVAAYAAVQQAYDNYRDRVRDEIGEEKERELYHAVQHISQVGTEDPDKKYLPVADPNKWSPYARFFDESSRQWVKDAEENRLFVQCQQNFLNDLLHARGHVFLNEAYDALDIPRSKEGQVVGWVIGEEGDNFIDFGIFEAFNANFVNGWERSILLDFNVDGTIYDKI